MNWRMRMNKTQVDDESCNAGPEPAPKIRRSRFARSRTKRRLDQLASALVRLAHFTNVQDTLTREALKGEVRPRDVATWIEEAITSDWKSVFRLTGTSNVPDAVQAISRLLGGSPRTVGTVEEPFIVAGCGYVATQEGIQRQRARNAWKNWTDEERAHELESWKLLSKEDPDLNEALPDKKTCNGCKGSGFAEGVETQTPDVRYFHCEPCSACRGSGIVAGPGEYTTEQCAECEEEGTVPKADPAPATLDLKDLQRANLSVLFAKMPRERLMEIAARTVLKDDLEPWADEETTPEDADIRAAFPTRTGLHALYAEAMRLVGARRSKGALVALVNWLLAREDKLKERVASLEGGIVAENKRVELEERALAQAVTLINEARSVVFDLKPGRADLHGSGVCTQAEDWCCRAQEFDILHGSR